MTISPLHVLRRSARAARAAESRLKTERAKVFATPSRASYALSCNYSHRHYSRPDDVPATATSEVDDASKALPAKSHLLHKGSSRYSVQSSVPLHRPAPRSIPDVALAMRSPSPQPPSAPSPLSRLSLISRHLDNRPLLEINSPYSTQRNSQPTDDVEYTPYERTPATEAEIQKHIEAAMTTQTDHPALLIPGPIEFDDAVLQSMSHYSESHVGAPFVKCFSETLQMLRKLFQNTDKSAQPFVLSGSGTLGWDLVAANLTEPGEDALVLHTGYFADSFADCFETYGVKATQLKAPIGDRPQLDEIEKALKEKDYKVVTVTHVDTSTGVLSEVKPLADLVKRVSPKTLVIVDGVCSIGAEELQFDAWGVDGVITASQKAIGVPAGLSISFFSGRAIEAFRARKGKPGSYFASFKNWLPIMQNYEANKPSYFATPSPQLIHALHTSLTQITSKPLSERFARHKEVSDKIKAKVAELGLKQLASKPENQASTMTAIYLPEGLSPPEVLPKLLSRGVIFAGGLHKEIASKYIRFGHMGVSITDSHRNDIDKALKALEEGLEEVGYKKP